MYHTKWVIFKAWEFKHPDFRANNEEALDNIRRKAPAPKKPNAAVDDAAISAQQMDLLIAQASATQQQVQQLQERYNDLSSFHSVMINEINGIQKRMVNHEHVMHNVISFLHKLDTQNKQLAGHERQEGQGPSREAISASPLQNASRLLKEATADMSVTSRNLEALTEMSMRMNGPVTTPPPDLNARPNAKGGSRTFSGTHNMNSVFVGDLEPTVYPIGVTNGIDPSYSEHINNIPYALPDKSPNSDDPRQLQKLSCKINDQNNPSWIRPPRILLVEDDPTCRRIGRKFLVSFECNVDSAVSSIESDSTCFANV